MRRRAKRVKDWPAIFFPLKLHLQTKGKKHKLPRRLKNHKAGRKSVLKCIGKRRMIGPGVAGGWPKKDIGAHLRGWGPRPGELFQPSLKQNQNPAPPWPPHLHETT